MGRLMEANSDERISKRFCPYVTMVDYMYTNLAVVYTGYSLLLLGTGWTSNMR